MQTYQELADCIRSGQLLECEIQEYFKDQVFFAWYKKKYSH